MLNINVGNPEKKIKNKSDIGFGVFRIYKAGAGYVIATHEYKILIINILQR